MNTPYFIEVDSALKPGIYEKMLEFVSDEKRKRIQKYRFDIDKKLSLYSEVLLRCLIRKALKLDNNDIILSSGEGGKPYLEKYDGFHFNISHTKNAIAVAISNEPIGIDVEKIKTADLRIADRFFTRAEKEWIYESGGSEEERFYTVWTQKEAALKRDGSGISNIRSVDVMSGSLSSQLSTIRINDYIVSICAGRRYFEKELIKLTEDELIDIWRFN